MQIQVIPEVSALVRASATHAAAILREALERSPVARLVAATGSSQIEFLKVLTGTGDIDWSRVELFHLDEYIGIGQDHPASFRRFLIDRLIAPAGITRAHLIDGLGNPQTVAETVGRALSQAPVDLLLCGIGENGHLAFNDPPADFEATAPYLVVRLDEACRRQQVGEGWFASLDDVPETAISMSIGEILKARQIVCLAHGSRKADAIASCFSNGITPDAPASALQSHPTATIYLDAAAAAKLKTAARQG